MRKNFLQSLGKWWVIIFQFYLAFQLKFWKLFLIFKRICGWVRRDVFNDDNGGMEVAGSNYKTIKSIYISLHHAANGALLYQLFWVTSIYRLYELLWSAQRLFIIFLIFLWLFRALHSSLPTLYLDKATSSQ